MLQRLVSVNHPDEETARRGQLLNIFVLSTLVFVLAVDGLLVISGGYGESLPTAVAVSLPTSVAALGLMCFWFAKRGRVMRASRMFVTITYLGMLASALIMGGSDSAAWIVIFWPIAMSGILLSPAYAPNLAGITILLYLAVGWAERVGVYDAPINASDAQIRFLYPTFAMVAVMGVAILTIVNNRSLDRALSRVRDLVGQLRRQGQVLEQEAARRESEYALLSDLVRQAAQGGSPEVILGRLLEALRAGLGYPALAVWQLDNTRRDLMCLAASGGPGEQAPTPGTRLNLGQAGILGRAMWGAKTILSESGSSSVPGMATSRSRPELAVLLRYRDKVMGVLHVVGMPDARFDPQTVRLIETAADEIAVARETAESLQAMEASLAEMGRLNRLLTLSGWQTLISSGQVASEYRYDHPQPGRPATGGASVPIQLRGQTLAVLDIERENSLTPSDLALIQALSGQIAVALDSAQLFEESRRLAAREQLVSTVATRVRSEITLEQVIKTTVNEIGQALNANRVAIHLAIPEAAPAGNGHGDQEVRA